MPWHAPAKIKRGGHFCVLTGMWVFQTITYTGKPTLHSHATKLGLRSSSSNANICPMSRFAQRSHKSKKKKKTHNITPCIVSLGSLWFKKNLYVGTFWSRMCLSNEDARGIFKTLSKSVTRHPVSFSLSWNRSFTRFNTNSMLCRR